MSAPEKVCEFVAEVAEKQVYPLHDLKAVEYVCRTHGIRGFASDSTVNEFGAFTLCPIGKIEYAVQRGLERIEGRLQEHLRKA